MNSNSHTTTELTLRLLNGLLSGVEFSLPAARTLFCVGEAQAFDTASEHHDVQSRADNTLFIPASSHGPNFAIEGGQASANGDFVYELYTEPSTLESAWFQTPCRAGELVFALKPAADPWSEAVLNYQAEAPADAQQPAEDQDPRSGVIKRWLLGVTLVTVLAVGATAGWSLLTRENEPARVAQLETVLKDANHRFVVRVGRDQALYVLAASEPDAAWARQALARAADPREARVLTLPEERARIERWLDSRQPGYFTLRLTDVKHPTLLLSSERALFDASAATKLQQELLASMPYAESVQFAWVSDTRVAGEAQARLDKLALAYTRQGDPANAVVYVLSGDIADGALSQLRAQLNEFDRAYGQHYVRFVLNMREDWLKGKSFKYGADGYVQASPTHWYFPQPL